MNLANLIPLDQDAPEHAGAGFSVRHGMAAKIRVFGASAATPDAGESPRLPLQIETASGRLVQALKQFAAVPA